MDPIRFIRDKAKRKLQRIVLPEGEDERILEAGFRIAREKIAKVLIIGRAEEIRKAIRKFGKYDEGMLEVIEPKGPGLIDRLADRFYEKRKHKNPDRGYYTTVAHRPVRWPS